MRFLSHLELVHLFYRASMRADLPLCFSEGFHPMPRIVFETALPVGMESLKEIVDIEVEGKIAPPEMMERLNQHLPPGIEILEAEEVPPFLRSLLFASSVRLLGATGSSPSQKKEPSSRLKRLWIKKSFSCIRREMERRGAWTFDLSSKRWR